MKRLAGIVAAALVFRIALVSLLAVTLRDARGRVAVVLGSALSLGTAYLASLPFAPSANPIVVFPWLANQFVVGQDLTNSTSENANNIWTLVAEPVPDSVRFLGLSLHFWGWVAFAVLTALTLAPFRGRRVMTGTGKLGYLSLVNVLALGERPAARLAAIG